MTRSVLLLNCGSSSLKYQVIDADSEAVLGSGIVQKIGDGIGTLDHKVTSTDGEQKFHLDQAFADHQEALAAVVAQFGEHGPTLDDVIAVGHRTVHGGEEFRAPTPITDEVIATLQRLVPLAPLHNPAGIAGIEAARAILPHVAHVGIFDTAFFGDLPAEAYTYAIDAELAKKHGIRRYGFHGTSHDYVSHKAAETLGREYESLKQIVCHLGNGASISAIRNGKPIDTSMGLTPLEGLVMGTRSGDIDPGIVAFLGRQEGMSTEQVDTLLNKKSGVFGMSGMTDMRDLEDAYQAGDATATAALLVYVHRLVKYIGAYHALLGGAEAISFTAGVGENSDIIRGLVCERLANLGFHLDADKNAVRSKQARVVSVESSPVAILVIPTNEELAMARQVLSTI